jgi:hypothetical protein
MKWNQCSRLLLKYCHCLRRTQNVQGSTKMFTHMKVQLIIYYTSNVTKFAKLYAEFLEKCLQVSTYSIWSQCFWSSSWRPGPMFVMTWQHGSLEISLHNWTVMALKSMRLYASFGNNFSFMKHHKRKSHGWRSGLRSGQNCPQLQCSEY